MNQKFTNMAIDDERGNRLSFGDVPHGAQILLKLDYLNYIPEAATTWGRFDKQSCIVFYDDLDFKWATLEEATIPDGTEIRIPVDM